MTATASSVRPFSRSVGLAGNLGQAGEDLPVVDLDAHAHAHAAEDIVHDLDQFEFIQQRLASDHIDVTLVKLAVTALLRPVGPPYGLDLVAFEGEENLVLVLDHETGERHGQVVTEPFLRRERRFLPAVLDAEQQFIALFAVFSQQGAEIFEGRGLDGLVSVFAEYRLDCVEDIVAACHFGRSEVSGPLGNRRFLCHFFSFDQLTKITIFDFFVQR